MERKITSRLPNFFNYQAEERLEKVKDFAGLNDQEVKEIKKGLLSSKKKEEMSENIIGVFPLPYSIAPNFLINDKGYLIPMVTEEPSVVAAASYGGKMAWKSGGIKAKVLGSLMKGQVYLIGIQNPQKAKNKIIQSKEDVINLANRHNPALVKAGGGARDVRVAIFKNNQIGTFLRIHLMVDVQDAMGANTIDQMAEHIAPLLEKITKGQALLKIVSNLADEKLVRVEVIIKKEALVKKGFDAEATIGNIIKASAIADSDIYRAVTCNKGILNGMGAVALATGNDWRALEAAAHGFASQSGKYKPLSKWTRDRQGNLVGTMTVPVVAGTVGGAIQSHALAKISLKILKITKAQELAQVIAAVGLVQNLAALRALVSEGIILGHKSIK